MNVSVRRPGAAGTRTETKNLNSLRFIQMAIDHEERANRNIEDGGEIDQETRYSTPARHNTNYAAKKMRMITDIFLTLICCQ